MSFRAIPDRIGRYRILSELGRGSMGHVYLALDPNIDRRIALKVLLPLLRVGAEEQSELRRRFLVEARAAGKLKHPGVVTLFDADTDAATGLSFIAMEWVDGPSLHDLIQQMGTLPIPRALEIARQVALALDAAHGADLVHRDIKPANILLTAAGEPKVTDFGIAKLASMSMTATGWVPGSPFYMSPEQVRGEVVDKRSDIYSLGIALYQSLTGEVPFHSDSLAGMTYMILEVDPRPPQPLNPGISDELAAVIQKALEKSPGDRFQNAVEFADALEEIADGTLWQTPAPDLAPARAGEGTTRLPAAGLPATTATEAAPPTAATARSVPRFARYAAMTVAVLVLLLLGPALRTSLSEAQSPVPLIVEAAAPFAEVGGPGRFDALDLEPPVPAEEWLIEEVSPTPRSTSRATVSPPSTPARVAALPPIRSAPAGPRAETAPSAVTPLVEPAVAAEPAQLELIFKNRLRNAEVSVWIDEEKTWSKQVAGPGNLFRRAGGRNVFTILSVEEGPRVIDVRVTGSEGKLDVVRRTTTDFVSGETKRLKVSMVLPNKLKLAWDDKADG